MEELSFPTIDSAHKPTGFIRGDVVKMYKESTSLEFPCLVLECEKLEKFKVDILDRILGHRSLVSTETQYFVYISLGGQLVQIGVLPNSRLRMILSNKVFDSFIKRVHLDGDTTIEGDMLFALCVSTGS